MVLLSALFWNRFALVTTTLPRISWSRRHSATQFLRHVNATLALFPYRKRRFPLIVHGLKSSIRGFTSQAGYECYNHIVLSLDSDDLKRILISSFLNSAPDNIYISDHPLLDFKEIYTSTNLRPSLLPLSSHSPPRSQAAESSHWQAQQLEAGGLWARQGIWYSYEDLHAWGTLFPYTLYLIAHYSYIWY